MSKFEPQIVISYAAQDEFEADLLKFALETLLADVDAGAWMELAYADAFEVGTFVLLHHLQYGDLMTSDSSVPPLLLAGQCNAAKDWRTVVEDIRNLIIKGATAGN